MMIYDLGLAGSDVDLANSIWRRFYLRIEDPDIKKIELLVKYIRKTVSVKKTNCINKNLHTFKNA